MPATTWGSGDLITAAKLNNDNTVSVLTDTARTISVTHTWSASQTFNAGFTGGSSCDITINTNKFTVVASSGNTAVGGTLAVTGATTVAAITASGLITGNAGVTVASGQTLTLTGATVAGTPTWSSSQAITLSTAAQPNVTSLGTLAANLLFTDATYDIGASGATRPRDLFLSRNLTVGGTAAVTGVVATGGANTTSAVAGDIVLKNNTGIRGANAAGTGTLGMLYLSSGNVTTINSNSDVLAFVNALTNVAAGAVSTYWRVFVNGAEYRIPLHATS